MPLPTSDLNTIANTIRAELETQFPAADAYGASTQGQITGLPRANNLNITAKVMAGGLFELQGLIQWAFQQRLPQTATLEHLEELGQLVGISRVQASEAFGFVEFTGVAGSLISAGDQVQGGSSQTYSVDVGGALDSNGLGTFAVTADEAGITHNLPGSAPMTLVNAIAGVNPTCAADGNGLVGGTAIETDEDLRARIILRYQTPQLGGAVSDYETWAYAFPGATRVWVIPAPYAGVGTVGVMFMMDTTYADGLPLAGDLSAMQAHLAQFAPASDIIVTGAPTLVPIDLEVTALTPDTGPVRAEIQTQLETFFRNEIQIGTPAGPFVLHKSKLVQAIADAAGEVGHTLVTPPGDWTLPSGQLAVLGTITYI